MRERRGAIADPGGDHRWVRFKHGVVQHQVILGPQAGQVFVHIRGADVDRWRVVVIEMRQDAIEIFVKQPTVGLEIESRGVVGIAESALQLWSGNESNNAPALIEGLEIRRRLLG